MATSEELENLVVKLVGDADSYFKMMEEAAKRTEDLGTKMDELTKKIDENNKKGKEWGKTMVAAISALGVGGFLKSALNSFEQMEVGQVRLKAAIGATGQDVDATSAKFATFASTLKATTGTSKGETFGLLQYASTLGLTADKAEQATQAAVGLQAALGGEAQHWIMVAKAVQDGNAHMLHHIPMLRGIQGDAAKLAAAQKLINDSWGVAKSMAGTVAGAFKQLDGAIAGLTRQFGEVVAEAITPFVKWMTELIDMFTKLDPVTKRIIVTVSLMLAAIVAIGPAMTALGAVLGPIVTLIGAAFSPVGAVIAVAIASITALSVAYGGFGKLATAVWDTIKTKALAFWEWIAPVAAETFTILKMGWETLGEFVGLIWYHIQNGAQLVYNYIMSTWQSLFGGTKLTWNSIKDFILDSLITLEYMLKNIGKTAGYAWDFAKLKAAEYAKAVLDFVNAPIPDMITDTITQSQAALAVVDEDFAKFKDRRKKELATFGKDVEGWFKKAGDMALGSGITAGAKFSKGLHEKLEASLAGSAESFTRISAYLDRLSNGATPANRAAQNDVGKPLEVRIAQAPRGSVFDKAAPQIDILKRIENHLAKIAGGGPNAGPAGIIFGGMDIQGNP